MKIPNPWPSYNGITRTVCKTPEGDVVAMMVTRGPEIEVSDNAIEVLIESVKVTGRGGAYKLLGPPKVWTKAWGLLDIGDHTTKLEIEAERGARVREDQEREDFEAREAAEDRVSREADEAEEWEAQRKEAEAFADQTRETDEEVEVDDEPLDLGDELPLD